MLPQQMRNHSNRMSHFHIFKTIPFLSHSCKFIFCNRLPLFYIFYHLVNMIIELSKYMLIRSIIAEMVTNVENCMTKSNNKLPFYFPKIKARA